MDPSGDLVHLVRLYFGNGGIERQKAGRSGMILCGPQGCFIRPENTMGNILYTKSQKLTYATEELWNLQFRDRNCPFYTC
jgi:hypothetical protein